MDAEKMTITLDTDDMRTVLASVGFVVCDWKEKGRDDRRTTRRRPGLFCCCCRPGAGLFLLFAEGVRFFT